ncbi:putative Co/Zn/Cd efflux system membrane fusion protein [gamma proteobacterium IMCC2047]|nr:putative Co/Zn/Cd efflux system membrane fusion protein [gamma proteobacterium IMCC2047]
MYVTAPIDEIDASQVRIGLPVLVTLDAFRGREFAGEVVRVAPYVTDVEKQARTVEVEVRLADIPEDVRLLVGYSADMTIILQRKEGVLKIPTEAILSSDEVWVLDNGQLQLRSLKTGIGNWTFTEVLEGLNEGDLVVRSPDAKGIAEGVQAEAIHD